MLEHDLGHDQVVDLDEAPPLSLLRAISQRSGIGLDRLRSMSFAGWVPWLLDGLAPISLMLWLPMYFSSQYYYRSTTTG